MAFFSSILGPIAGAAADRRAHSFTAQIAERNAVIARQQTQADTTMQSRRSKKAIGSMRAAYAASGVNLEGSPLDILEDSVAQAELERQNIGYNGELRAQGYEVDASMSRARASNAMTTGFMKAASGILTGASSGSGTGRSLSIFG